MTMEITKDFLCGNIEIVKQDGDEFLLQPETRGDTGYFYWLFRIDGAQGRKVTFKFTTPDRVGFPGAAVSRNMTDWSWTGTKFTYDGKDGFTYDFAPDETSVYFSQHMVYTPLNFECFVKNNGIEVKTFCKTRKNRDVSYFTVGNGERKVLVTSRQHACESTGTYAVQGFAEECMKTALPGVEFIFVPFVDYDGVCDGDAGKNRSPHDHNRDYEEGIYPEIRKIKSIAETQNLITNFDFHAPYHCGDINDCTYFMRCDREKGGIYDKFSSELIRLTSENGFRYYGIHDIAYGAKWNEDNMPNMISYMMKHTEKKYTFCMEIPFFGLPDNYFDQSRAFELGRRVFKAALSSGVFDR